MIKKDILLSSLDAMKGIEICNLFNTTKLCCTNVNGKKSMQNSFNTSECFRLLT